MGPARLGPPFEPEASGLVHLQRFISDPSLADSHGRDAGGDVSDRSAEGRLRWLQSLLGESLITWQEYSERRKAIIAEL